MNYVFNVKTNFEHNIYHPAQLVGSAMVTAEVIREHAPVIIKKHECVQIRDICITSTDQDEAVVLCNLQGGTRFSFTLVFNPNKGVNGWEPRLQMDIIYRQYLNAARAAMAEIA